MAAYTTIDDPSAFFQPVLYSGNGSDDRDIALGTTQFAPNLTVIKRRDETNSWKCFDTVRGATKQMIWDGENAESTFSDGLQAFNSDGFEVGADEAVNDSGGTYLSLNWKAGTTSGIGTSGQDITPSAYSINTTSKFGIYAYGGNGTDDSQINHGLGVAPKFIIQKARSNGDQDWHVFHAATTPAPETDYLYFNETNATTDRVESWSDQLPDTTDITLGTSNDGNQSGQTFIMYAWGEVQGFSKFGAYRGNANAEGPFVYTGFRPAVVIVKRTDETGGWYVYDNKRAGYNGSSGYLQANTTSAEDTNAGNFGFDILSNGFKVRGTYATINGNTGEFSYIAFAEAPLVNSEGEPCNAR